MRQQDASMRFFRRSVQGRRRFNFRMAKNNPVEICLTLLFVEGKLEMNGQRKRN